MDYELVTDDIKRQMLVVRLKKYEENHFNATINLAVSESAGVDPVSIENTISKLEEVINICRAELEKLPTPDVTKKERPGAGRLHQRIRELENQLTEKETEK